MASRGSFPIVVLGVGLLVSIPPARAADPPPVFEDHVLPILKVHCFDCHSTGRRKHGLDVRQKRLLLRGGDSGPAVVPGDPGASLLLKKVSAGAMPPGDREKLSPAAVELIRRWIQAGAPARGEEKPLPERDDDFLTPEDRLHWAFRPVARPPLPSFGGSDRARTPVDAFILEKLRARGLGFAPDAEPRALARRFSFDLLGLPPSPEEVAELEKDPSEAAVERLLDRLLASPHYGERWGRHWLDAAGYADSDGFTDQDTERPQAWKYRDWVIRSFNEDKPYDRFLLEQIAGDELAGWPGAALSADAVDLLTATGFLRCAADGSGQGGVDPLRARNQVIADTLGILGSGVLGLTLACAQCHDHRYDPVSQRDYHRLRAALEPAYDVLAWKTPAERRISLYTEADRKKAAEVAAAAEARRVLRRTLESELVRGVVEKVLATQVGDADREAARAAVTAPAEKRSAEAKTLLARYPSLNVSGGTLYQYDQAAADRLKALDAEIEKLAATRPPEDFLSALWEMPGPVPPNQRPPGRLFLRGNPDQPAEEVAPGVPVVLAPPGGSWDLPPNEVDGKTSGRRLRLARWLTRPEHPLTARVFVNRMWMHHFGRGLVATPGDFGRQGDRPTHPELLDWLADEFTRGGWKLKRLHKLLLLSTVYRQGAVAPARSLDADPENELYSRRPILRLEAEAIRDAMLCASGALNRQAGGPPVPVREDADGSIVVGIDKKAESNRPGPEVALGADGFRRSVYVQMRRTRPLSFLSAFDAPVMETNCTRRSGSLAPTQALVLLNGPFAREQAALFAKRVEREAADEAGRVERAFRLALGRAPSAAERAEGAAFLAEVKAAAAGPEAALNALTDLCHVLWNANEFIMID